MTPDEIANVPDWHLPGRSISVWQRQINAWSHRKEWSRLVDGQTVIDREPLALLMLVTSEVAEAAEVCREKDFDPLFIWGKSIETIGGQYAGERRVDYADLLMLGGKLPKPEGFGIELADIIIRVLHMAEAFGIDIDRCMRLKMAYNETREPKHGKRA